MKRNLLRALSISLGLLFLASCNGSSNGSGFLGNLPGPITPTGFTRMYDAQCNGSFIGNVYIIPPPFAAPLTPTASFSETACANALAFNLANGVLATSLTNAKVLIFNPPYSSGSMPVVTLGPGGVSTLSSPHEMAFDASGNLWVANQGNDNVVEFTTPFSASAAPAATNTAADEPTGLAINPTAGLMFIGDVNNNNVKVVPAPYTGVATATLTDPGGDPTALAVDQLGRLFVGDANTGKIYVFVPPYATGNSPAFALTTGGAVLGLALDSSQNVYAQLLDASVVVFNGPVLGPIGAPSALLGCPSTAPPCALGNWAGVGFGP